MNRFLKRFFDVFFSSLGLLLLSPFFLIVAIAIKLDSEGPVLFWQDRRTKNGRIFRMYKFRSMVVNAEKSGAGLFSYVGDSRVTKVGRFLRSSSIDELPQLLNVLRGDMSIVGPRPALPREVELYNDYQRQRLYVTPGLSCYWQIAPHRNEMSFDEWVALDLKYIQERSFWVDWKIILLTIRAMFMKYGE